MDAGKLGKPRPDSLVRDGLPGALPAPLSPVPTVHALCRLSAAFCPAPCHAPHSVLSPVPKLPIQVQAPPPEDSNSSSDSDYEPYDFSSQPPVALTTFYSECLRPDSRGPTGPHQGEGPAGWGTCASFPPR